MNYMYMHIEFIRYYSHTHAYSDLINAAGHHLVLILMQTLSFWINLLESYSEFPCVLSVLWNCRLSPQPFCPEGAQKIPSHTRFFIFLVILLHSWNGSNAFGRFFWKKIRITVAQHSWKLLKLPELPGVWPV